jgi:hypothetical protein
MNYLEKADSAAPRVPCKLGTGKMVPNLLRTQNIVLEVRWKRKYIVQTSLRGNVPLKCHISKRLDYCAPAQLHKFETKATTDASLHFPRDFASSFKLVMQLSDIRQSTVILYFDFHIHFIL